MTDFYHLAPSKKPAKPVVSMFVCSPRQTRTDKRAVIVEEPEWSTVYEEMQLLDVNMLERHPYSPQTFIPLGQSPTDTTTYYLVVVAPTLPTSRRQRDDTLLPPYPTDKQRKRRSIFDLFSRARPKPFTNETTPPSRLRPTSQPELPKGQGPPDLGRLRAFIVSGNQAITYGAGTWHAPMAVIGEKPMDFVVIQYKNGVGMEDTQELEVRANGEGLTVEVETPLESSIVKAKL
jgi:ureidoglycolate lyase